MTDSTPHSELATRLREYADRDTGYIYAGEIADLREAAGLIEQLEVLREFYEAHWEVEQGITDFDLHAEAVARLEVADERVRGLLEEK